MLVPFEDLSKEARVWIYPSNRPFRETEIEEITKKLEIFITAWSAHGAALQASFSLPYNRFIVIATKN